MSQQHQIGASVKVAALNGVQRRVAAIGFFSVAAPVFGFTWVL